MEDQDELNELYRDDMRLMLGCLRVVLTVFAIVSVVLLATYIYATVLA